MDWADEERKILEALQQAELAVAQAATTRERVRGALAYVQQQQHAAREAEVAEVQP